jgi:hypothetical protein
VIEVQEVVPWVGGGRRETSKGKGEESKGRSMVVVGCSFGTHDLKYYVTKEKRTFFL